MFVPFNVRAWKSLESTTQFMNWDQRYDWK